MSPYRIPVAALLALALVPAGASAATVTYEGPPGSEVLVYRAAPGESNRVGVQPAASATTVALYDSSEHLQTIPARCEDHRDYRSITCEAEHGVRLELGDGVDSAYVSTDTAVPVTMFGGAGNDDLDGNDQANRFFGEDGDDVLRGSGGDDDLDGGPGNDTLDGYSGSDRLSGGEGDDLLHPDGYERAAADVVDGGPGVDRIASDYATRYPDEPQPTSAFTLAGGADDGRPGEGDDVRRVERFFLSKAATFVGTDAPEFVKLHQVGESGRLDGLGGDDELRGGDGADTIDGGTGADHVDGGYGDDVITGGAGKDRISADLATGDCGPYWCKYPYGNDTVLARDGEVDSVTCGAGADRVVADADDVVAPDCEAVERSSSGGPVGSGGSGGSGGGSGAGGGAGAGAGGAATGVPLTLVAGQRLRTVLRQGLRVRIGGTPTAARIALRVTVGGRTVASGSGKRGSVAVVRFTAAARRTLSKRATVRLTLVAGTTRIAATLRR